MNIWEWWKTKWQAYFAPRPLGRRGEDAAARFLTRLGYQIVARGERGGLGEIDLVAVDGRVVVFVEVKTRGGTGFGAGREAIGWRKRRTLARVAEVWRLRHGRPQDSYRFDVVEVCEVHGGPALVTHLEDAWRP